jgi:hypothetical protein
MPSVPIVALHLEECGSSFFTPLSDKVETPIERLQILLRSCLVARSRAFKRRSTRVIVRRTTAHGLRMPARQRRDFLKVVSLSSPSLAQKIHGKTNLAPPLSMNTRQEA